MIKHFQRVKNVEGNRVNQDFECLDRFLAFLVNQIFELEFVYEQYFLMYMVLLHVDKFPLWFYHRFLDIQQCNLDEKNKLHHKVIRSDENLTVKGVKSEERYLFKKK